MFWLMDQNHPMHFVLAAEIVGRTEVWQWQQGLDHLCGQLPLVWSQIVTNQAGEPEFHRCAQGSVQLDVVHHAPQDWTATAAAQLARPFDALQAPLLRAALVYDIDRSAIILCAHHAIADGMSLTYFLRDLMKLVIGETVELPVEARPLEHIVRRSIETAEALPPPSSSRNQPAREPMPYRVPNGSQPSIKSLRLDEDVTSLLRARAHAERCSMHGALCAAFALAHLDLVPGTHGLPPRISSPVDVRRRLLDDSDHFGLCICGIAVDDEPNEVEFWDKARHFSNSIAPVKTAAGMASLVSAAQQGIAQVKSVRDAADLAARLFAGDIDLSNLGVVDIPESYEALNLESLWGPMVTLGFSAEQSVGASTFGGCLHLLHMSYAPIEGLLEKASGLLVQSVR